MESLSLTKLTAGYFLSIPKFIEVLIEYETKFDLKPVLQFHFALRY